MSGTLCCAYLRVYQDLASFPPGVVETTQKPGFSLLPMPERAAIFEKRVEGRSLFCPALTRLRTLLSMLSSQPELRLVFYSPAELHDARMELESLQSGHPGIQPYLLQSPWHVPIRWFIPFADDERRITEEGSGPRLAYETTIQAAVDRLDRAVSILSPGRGMVHPSWAGMVLELRGWLRSFDPTGLLELDYASVSTLFDPDELADDHSVAEVWTALTRLEAGDLAAAMDVYRGLSERWTASRLRSASN